MFCCWPVDDSDSITAIRLEIEMDVVYQLVYEIIKIMMIIMMAQLNLGIRRTRRWTSCHFCGVHGHLRDEQSTARRRWWSELFWQICQRRQHISNPDGPPVSFVRVIKTFYKRHACPQKVFCFFSTSFPSSKDLCSPRPRMLQNKWVVWFKVRRKPTPTITAGTSWAGEAPELHVTLKWVWQPERPQKLHHHHHHHHHWRAKSSSLLIITQHPLSGHNQRRNPRLTPSAGAALQQHHVTYKVCSKEY